MLLAILIDAETLKGEVPPRTKLRLYRPWKVDRGLHGELFHTAFHHAELESNDTCHFNRSTEGYFSIALAEMEVAYAELCAFHVDGQVDFGATAKSLDVAVATMFWPSWYRSRSLLTYLLLQFSRRRPSMHVLRIRRLSDGAVEVCMRGDELGFALVPRIENFGGGRAAQDARVDEPSEADAGDVARRAEYALEVPDGFCADRVG